MGRARTTGPALAAAASAARVYTVSQVTVATLIGTPIAGALLLAANQAALGDPGRRDRTILLGALITIAVMAITFALPESLPTTLVPALYTLAALDVARRTQGNALIAFRTAGGRRHSHLRMLAIAILCLFFVATSSLAVARIVTGSPNGH